MSHRIASPPHAVGLPSDADRWMHRALLLAMIALSQAGLLHAQSIKPTPVPDPDQQIVTQVDLPPQTPAQLRLKAWTMLRDALADGKHADLRIQALAALGLLGGDARALTMIETAMLDHDVDVRSAAVLAAGETRSPSVTTDLRRMLDDKEPQVAFAAALTLWKLNDRSGEDILLAVADGERTASAGLVDSTEHTVNRELHHPAALARFGAMQGAGMLLGPFGFGITAYEYLHRNGSDVSRVSAIAALAQNHTGPIRAELVSAINDKDPGVRAEAAKGLSNYHDADAAKAITPLFLDDKPPVRLTAAAAYLLSTGKVEASQKKPSHFAR